MKKDLLSKMNQLENKKYELPDNSKEFNYLKTAIADLNSQINYLKTKNENLLKVQQETVTRLSSQKNEPKIIREEIKRVSVPRKSYVSSRVIQTGPPVINKITSTRYEVKIYFLLNK